MTLIDHLRSLEEALLRPEVRKDGDALRHHLAPHFLEFGSSGRVFNRDRVIKDLTQEPPSEPPAIADYTLLASTDSWALTTYRSTRAAPAPTTSLRSSTWIMLDGRWQMLFHQGTPTTSALS